MRSLTFSFSSVDSSLVNVVYRDHVRLNYTVRGRTTGAIRDAGGTFPWSKGVKALCLLAVRTAEQPGATIFGDRGTGAASLDYALSRGPRWIHEMFGTDVDGLPVARRLFRRSNPEMKRPGPVVISFSGTVQEVVVVVDASRVQSGWEMELLRASLEESLSACVSPEAREPGLTRLIA